MCLAVYRSFIWSMTSWKRGHMCQQHSTTTQPSRPSKARPVWGLQLFLRVYAVIQEGALWCSQLGFYSSRIRLFDCRGRCHHQHCPSPPLPFRKVSCCPTTPTRLILFLKFLLLFYFLFCAGSVLCLRLLNLKPFYIQMVGWFTCDMKNKKPGEANLTSSDASKGWKKCNVYCCTIFSNKRTQNLFAFIFMQTLPDVDIYTYNSPPPPSWVSGGMHSSHVHALAPPSPFFTSFCPV